MADSTTAAADATHGDHAHPPHLAHHFDTPEQQFSSGTTGMWLFLATEILLFAGLFCAYAVYRGLHPEVFLRVDEYLDRTLGAINTVVLLCSSFTMAAAVWAAQHSKQKMLVGMLIATLVGGLGFMCIKYVEYKHKWEHHLLWGAHFDPDAHHGAHGEHGAADPVDGERPAEAVADHGSSGASDGGGMSADDEAHTGEPPEGVDRSATAAAEERWQYEPAAVGPRGLLRAGPRDGHGAAGPPLPFEDILTAQFFGIYFAMTGLHGIHVLAGMALIAWLVVRSAKGHFNAAYFTPVPLVGLYWHLVDLVWIYLFPLLYLIH